ncbi:MAG: DUF1549 domain-containing protein [Planctomycetes bacterium]|nr:DUF1549 domain-containing protein [Planctomycetota bacterium]
MSAPRLRHRPLGFARLALLLLTIALMSWTAPAVRAADTVSFERDVMAVLSRTGCNQGACHGNQNGKNGFKLSLRGQSPEIDYRILLREQFNRRVNVEQPEQSLLLLKAIAAVPHGGGARFRPGSLEYNTLRDWIAQGAPSDPADLPKLVGIKVEPRVRFVPANETEVPIRAVAKFADGAERDVTRWAVYTPSTPIVTVSPDGVVTRQQFGETSVLVRYLHQQATARLAFVSEHADFRWPNPPVKNVVDKFVMQKLERLRIAPSQLCTDTVFARRAYLDLLGRLPSIDEAGQFAADTAADKRARLIDALLEEPEFADFWAMKWADLLRAEERTLDRKGVQAFHHWIRQAIAEGQPLNEFAADMLDARGSTYSNPPTNFYRAHRDPITRAEAIGQVFLGVRLQCARCHNHPFDHWTQDDYYRWAGVFARVDYKIVENRRNDRNDKHEFDGEQIVYVTETGEVKNPDTGKDVPAQLLATKKPLDSGADRLESLADWIRQPNHPLFAPVQVNRIWFHLMGRGLVEPIDDFRATNPASHPELLDALVAEFKSHRFDLRHLIRLIMNSHSYQMASETNSTNADDELNYSHQVARALSAEPLLDALHQATGTPSRFKGFPAGLRAVQIPGLRTDKSRNGAIGPEEQFLLKFGKPARQLSCECERSSDVTLGQTFQMVSGGVVNELLTAADNRIARAITDKQSDDQIIDQLFWATLSRPPSAEVRGALASHVAQQKDRRQGLEDVLWSLVNSKEFLLRQ